MFKEVLYYAVVFVGVGKISMWLMNFIQWLDAPRK